MRPDRLLAGLAAAAFSVLLPACGNHDASKGAGRAAKADDHGHDHGEHAHGPNGGELVELDGGAFHAEIGHDHEHGIIRVWVLGTDAKTPVAVEAPVVNLTKGAVQLTLTGAAPIKDGKATSWTAQHDALKADPWDGRIRLVIEGKTYQAPLEGEGHAHDPK